MTESKKGRKYMGWEEERTVYCTVLYFTVLYCTVLYCTVLYCTVLYCTMLYYPTLNFTILYITSTKTGTYLKDGERVLKVTCMEYRKLQLNVAEMSSTIGQSLSVFLEFFRL